MVMPMLHRQSTISAGDYEFDKVGGWGYSGVACVQTPRICMEHPPTLSSHLARPPPRYRLPKPCCACAVQVLGTDATQGEVYAAAVRPIVDDVLAGYNGTVMAYGQTGAGKTHTLSSVTPESIGALPRAIAEVFAGVGRDASAQHAVFMSYVQIYMELIQAGRTGCCVYG
jgi:Kinesin motor domain